MSANHTPGPWAVIHSTVHPGMVEVFGPRIQVRGFTVATDIDAGTADRIEADARLIAAAPDLLAALKDLSRLADAIYVRMSDGEMALMRDAWGKADAAIARAEDRS
jgi:hypothetical protein